MPNITAHNISLVYDSISDLLQADDGFLKPGMVVQTLGYYSRGDCPPGIFYVESQLNQNDVVDGGKLFQSSYTLEDNSRLYFRRVLDETYPVSVGIYGALGDGVTDDCDAINRCIANNRNITFEVDKTYKVSNSINIINRCGITLDCNNATFLRIDPDVYMGSQTNTTIVNFPLFNIDSSSLNYGDLITMRNREKITIKNFKYTLGLTGSMYKGLTESSIISIQSPVCEVEIDGATIVNETYGTAIHIDELRNPFGMEDKITLKNIKITTHSGYFDTDEYLRDRNGISISRDNVYLENITILNFDTALFIDNFNITNIEINGFKAINNTLPNTFVVDNNGVTSIPVPDLKAPSKIMHTDNHIYNYLSSAIRYFNQVGSEDPSYAEKLIIRNATIRNYWAFMIFRHELADNSYIEMDNISFTFDNLYENSGLKNSYFIYSESKIQNEDILKTKITNSNIVGLPNVINTFYNSNSSLEHVCENSTFENYFDAPILINTKNKLEVDSYDKNWVTKPYSDVNVSSSCMGKVILKPYNTMRNLAKNGYGAWYVSWRKHINSHTVSNNGSLDYHDFYTVGNTSNIYAADYSLSSEYMTPSNNSSIKTMCITQEDVDSECGGWFKIPSRIIPKPVDLYVDNSTDKLSILNYTNIQFRPFAASKKNVGKIARTDSTYGSEKLLSNNLYNLPQPGDMYGIHFGCANVLNGLKLTVSLNVEFTATIPIFYDFNEPELRSYDIRDRHGDSSLNFFSDSDVKKYGFDGSLTHFTNGGAGEIVLNGNTIFYSASNDKITLKEKFPAYSKVFTFEFDTSNTSVTYGYRSVDFVAKIPEDAFNILMQNKINELYNSVLDNYSDNEKMMIMKNVRYHISDFVLNIGVNSTNVDSSYYTNIDNNRFAIYDLYMSKCDPADAIHFFKEDNFSIYNHIYEKYDYKMYNAKTNNSPTLVSVPNFNYRRLFYNHYNRYSHMVNVNPTSNPVYSGKSFRVLSIPWINNIAPYHRININDVYAYMNKEVREYSYADGIPEKLLDIIPQPNGFSVRRMSCNNSKLKQVNRYPEIDKPTCVSLINVNKYYFKKKTTFYFNAIVATNSIDDFTGRIDVTVDGNLLRSYSRDDFSTKSFDIEPGQHGFSIVVNFVNENITYEDVEMWVSNFYITENPDERYFYKDIKYNEYNDIPIYKNGIISITPSTNIHTNYLDIPAYSPLSVSTGRGQLFVSYPCNDDAYQKYLYKDMVLPVDVDMCKDVYYGTDAYGNNLAFTLTASDSSTCIYPYIYPTNCSENDIKYELTDFSDVNNPCCSIENGYITRLCQGTCIAIITVGNDVSVRATITCT